MDDAPSVLPGRDAKISGVGAAPNFDSAFARYPAIASSVVLECGSTPESREKQGR
jgi:hypothetical protein